MRNPKQTRMCIACRKRFHQSLILRLQAREAVLCVFSGSGRSFYVCKECQANPKTLKSITKRYKILEVSEGVNTIWKK
ncbi:DUF448 domain-containing protein [Helicobacter sp. MIT 00-7814]|uniref:DUF448 domain-containing protein n=1 Tax=unclassified Helicobacter TaxID=2593540 RepID=UPI000E1F020D|nr:MULTISPECIES: DUF448 domain-containing protein [unclassified Helicobacter]RDU57181.1 DUF448 domain-containing protein [Helicobacter sp. MIT 00-7814]RDU57733.1 DUF448 domain-containing protein [Helicobacter sp. MIT 99-10781]